MASFIGVDGMKKLTLFKPPEKSVLFPGPAPASPGSPNFFNWLLKPKQCREERAEIRESYQKEKRLFELKKAVAGFLLAAERAAIAHGKIGVEGESRFDPNNGPAINDPVVVAINLVFVYSASESIYLNALEIGGDKGGISLLSSFYNSVGRWGAEGTRSAVLLDDGKKMVAIARLIEKSATEQDLLDAFNLFVTWGAVHHSTRAVNDLFEREAQNLLQIQRLLSSGAGIASPVSGEFILRRD